VTNAALSPLMGVNDPSAAWDNPLIEPAVFDAHGVFDGLREGGVVDEQAEFDVAVLGIVGEVRAGRQDDGMVDDDDLGVADQPVTPRRPPGLPGPVP
jgi:hypothetical protein